MAEQDIPPPTITAMKIPIIRKGEYDIWSMRMRQYICHTDHNLWDVIVNGDLEEEPAPTTGETSAPPAPKTAKQLAARRNQERVKSILLLAIPDEYLLKFHNVADAKSLWEAIKSSLDKAYDRFQKLISQLEVHGALISKEDINQKFLRSLPSSWNQIALIMRNKPDIDEIDIDDLYNNLRNTGGTNEVSTDSGDFRVSTASGINQVPSTPCAHDVAYSFLAQPTTSPQLKNKDFQQMDGDDLENRSRWQECRSGRNQGRRSYGDNGRSNAPTTESSSQALVAQDGLGGYDWSNDFEVEPVNYALMAISSSSSSSSSDSEVQKCSKQCLESFKTLQKNYDTEREKHNRAKLEIRGYEIALESLESRILGHEKNELAWGEKYEFQNYELKCREIKINNLNLELEKVVKERDELKDKIAKWEESTKNLDEILNSQMSARDKTGLGYGTQLNELSSNHETDSENSLSVFDVRSSDEESTPANDMSSKVDEYHAVPPPIRRNFLTQRSDISFAGFDEYAIRNKIIESQTTELNTKTSETAGVIIEDWNSDDEEEEYEVQTVRPETQTVKTNRVIKSGSNYKKQGNWSYYTKPAFRPKDLKQDVKTFGIQNMTTVGTRAVVNTGKDKLRFNLFSVSQMCDKKNSVLFTESECLILSPSFKLLDESQVVFRAPRKDDVYSLDLKNIIPSRGHLVRGLPSKVFVNDHTCVACKKGKQHKASCKAKLERIIRKPLELLHMDLFGPVSVESINKKRYCLVVTDDFSRFSWVFFLATKDETSEILCNLIIGLENQLSHNVKIIRCDNETEFKNHVMNEFCAKKGIKRKFCVPRTPQHNGVAERKNRTLIEAARTMLADSLLPILFWAEAVNTACYVLNRVLVTKPQNKTPYELLIGKSPSISFMRPFGCPLTILNTLDSLGKFDGKSDEGYLLGYSTSSKAFRVYNKRTKRVEENLHINFLEDQLNFDVENHVNMDAICTQDSYVAGSSGKDKGPTQEYILLPLQPHRTSYGDVSRQAFEEKKRRIASQKKAAQATSTNKLSTDWPSVSTDRPYVSIDRLFVSTDRSNTPYVSAASTPTGANAGESSFVYLGGKIPIDASTLPNADLPI
ncbi:putative ribonuclease H-like domain-containing protein [Tanacetum coccineum]|uniref:Ribonuclease H-like domain-containing protein n=2 Tax=Tanacetum coccineum TaxID=301880 RepID=A0ABQ4WW23_9ASTR